jgi:hypothetical protein
MAEYDSSRQAGTEIDITEEMRKALADWIAEHWDYHTPIPPEEDFHEMYRVMAMARRD